MKTNENLMNVLTVESRTYAYKDYIFEHKQNVKKAWKEIQEKCKDLNIIYDDFNWYCIDVLISEHDDSKFDSREFNAYRINFYPVDDQEKDNNQRHFKSAWLHHQLNNPHHWQFWQLLEKFPELKINVFTDPVHYVVEMICDWQAMGYKFGDNAYSYYQKNKDKIIIPDNCDYIFNEIMNRIK